MVEKTQADKCAERYGLTNALITHIPCRCIGCIGHLQFDDVNILRTEAFLLCTECGCTYTTATTKHYQEAVS